MSIEFENKTIMELEDLELNEKRVLVRVDFNVPVNDGVVLDDFRIRCAIPTIKHLLERKCKVVLMSHLGRPNGQHNEKYSLLPVASKLSALMDHNVILPDDCIGDGVKKNIIDQKADEIILLENLRFHSQEEANDKDFALELKNNCDVFINDAFGALHRAHASTDQLPRLFKQKAMGFLVRDELKHLGQLNQNPEKPFMLILGGAKVSDKVKVLERMFRKVDAMLIGGAMSLTFLKALGVEVGQSKVESDAVLTAKKILEQARERNVRIDLPIDFVVAGQIEKDAQHKTVLRSDIPKDMMALDIGPKTVQKYLDILCGAKTVFWNGPMGCFETAPFDNGTNQLAQGLAAQNSIRIVGGGDSASALLQSGHANEMTHISTGGGASLEYLEGKALPGLKALAV